MFRRVIRIFCDQRRRSVQRVEEELCMLVVVGFNIWFWGLGNGCTMTWLQLVIQVGCCGTEWEAITCLSLRQFEKILGSLRQFEGIWGNLGEFEGIWGNLKEFEWIWGNLKEFEGTWGNLRQFEESWGSLREFEANWGNLRKFEELWGNLR